MHVDRRQFGIIVRIAYSCCAAVGAGAGGGAGGGPPCTSRVCGCHGRCFVAAAVNTAIHNTGRCPIARFVASKWRVATTRLLLLLLLLFTLCCRVLLTAGVKALVVPAFMLVLVVLKLHQVHVVLCMRAVHAMHVRCLVVRAACPLFLLFISFPLFLCISVRCAAGTAGAGAGAGCGGVAGVHSLSAAHALQLLLVCAVLLLPLRTHWALHCLQCTRKQLALAASHPAAFLTTASAAGLKQR